MVQTLGSGHDDLGLSESNPASTYDKAKWHAYQAHVYRKGVS